MSLTDRNPAASRAARVASPSPAAPVFVSVDGPESAAAASAAVPAATSVTTLPADPTLIRHAERMRPFLMSIVSDADLWMYVSSLGSLTAGRGNEDRSIFPYETDDKIHQHAGITGPTTMFRVRVASGPSIRWTPFSSDFTDGVSRTLRKPAIGNRVTFEEVNESLGLSFAYTWQACEEFGWVRSCTLRSLADQPLEIELVDGVLNLLPANASLGLQRSGSCLINAYTSVELDPRTGLAIYRLTSRIIDRAEPAESLHANTAFHVGLSGSGVLLSGEQLGEFVRTGEARPASHLTGRRGAYIVTSRLSLRPGETREWQLVLDAHRDQHAVAQVNDLLAHHAPDVAQSKIRTALDRADDNLRRKLAAADAVQSTGDAIASSHHAANVLFNTLRGGTFLHNYDVPLDDFRDFVRTRNRAAIGRIDAALRGAASTITHGDLLERCRASGDADATRLALEYVPLTFGRRHGDPSRPWNRFNIHVRNADGSPALSYQGNWRDIFQNWEALAQSFPNSLESLIAKFVNASTIDGFNPYRVTRDGIEWEVPDPHDPWSHIGYWGDHQIIYLLKLLEAGVKHRPASLAAMLREPLFSYARVPYRLKPYAAMLRDRHHTIEFDWTLHRQIERDLADVGTDARLLRDDGGAVVHATLAEKLLVPLLSKLSNFVPGGGIWMNTQRPEWNDANNALVGNGVSMVTLAYVSRYVRFLDAMLAGAGDAPLVVHAQVTRWLRDCAAIFAKMDPRAAVDPTSRKVAMDALGAAFGHYREAAYEHWQGDQFPVAVASVREFLKTVQACVDETIRLNRRPDGLFHAYNLLELSADESRVTIGHLDEMLEGQVAVLSSGVLAPAEAADTVDALFASKLWRADQQSFVLYPIRTLPGFLEANQLADADVTDEPLLRRLLQSEDRTIVQADLHGHVRFNCAFANVADLDRALDALERRPEFATLVNERRDAVRALYERTFQHHRFTGRSGTMYGYEGIGCIYWHMVAKLLLAVQENAWRAIDERADAATIDRLARQYYRIRGGLGFNKSATAYGAFPLDPYSHTPLHAGAQQPGMTGQVKEELLTRAGELGVRVHGGRICFEPRLLRPSEFHNTPAAWDVVHVDDEPESIVLPAGSLGFSLMGVPVIYERSANPQQGGDVWLKDGTRVAFDGVALPADVSRRMADRDGSVRRVRVRIAETTLLRPQ